MFKEIKKINISKVFEENESLQKKSTRVPHVLHISFESVSILVS